MRVLSPKSVESFWNELSSIEKFADEDHKRSGISPLALGAGAAGLGAVALVGSHHLKGLRIAREAREALEAAATAKATAKAANRAKWTGRGKAVGGTILGAAGATLAGALAHGLKGFQEVTNKASKEYGKKNATKVISKLVRKVKPTDIPVPPGYHTRATLAALHKTSSSQIRNLAVLA